MSPTERAVLTDVLAALDALASASAFTLADAGSEHLGEITIQTLRGRMNAAYAAIKQGSILLMMVPS